MKLFPPSSERKKPPSVELETREHPARKNKDIISNNGFVFMLLILSYK